MLLESLQMSQLVSELSKEEIRQYRTLVTDGCYDENLPEGLSKNNTWTNDTLPPKKPASKTLVRHIVLSLTIDSDILFSMKNIRPCWIHSFPT